MTGGTGCSLFKRGDAAGVSEKQKAVAAKFVAGAGEEQTNMSRSSGLATYARLKKIFPNLDNYIPQLEFTVEPVDRTHLPLGSKVRPVSAQAQYTLRRYATALCELAGSEGMFESKPELLMAGEIFPADLATRLAFVAARTGWAFPYRADSPEVQALAKIYTTLAYVEGVPDPAQDEDARRTVCLAVLTAPTFWIGNPSPADAVRRLALELGRRVPTFAEYSDFLNQRMTLADYGRKLQQEPAYMAVVKDWHRNWLSFYWENELQQDIRPTQIMQGNYLGQTPAYIFKFDPNALEGQSMDGPPIFSIGPTLRDALVRYIGETGNTHPSITVPGQPTQRNRVGIAATKGDYVKFGAESRYAGETYVPVTCDVTKDQAFDPRTVKVQWEQRNPVNSRWEIVGSWERTALGGGAYSDWRMRDGSVTGSDGVAFRTSLRDWVYASSLDFTTSDDPYEYKVVEGAAAQSKLIGSPLGTFYTRDRRVRRFAVSGEQDGVSVIQFPRTGATARICNGIDRYFATCAYRPNSRNASDFNLGYAMGDWTPATGKLTYSQYQPANRYTAMHPYILDEMKCGVPNMGAIANLGPASRYALPQDDPNESIAWPKGYASLDQDVSALPLNQVAHYLLAASFNVAHFDAWETANYEFPETLAEVAMKKDMREEPFRLIEDIITKNLDYRLLVTAPYTFGGDYYEYLLREQGYFLPTGPRLQGGAPFVPSGSTPPHRIDFASFAPIPINALESVDGRHGPEADDDLGDLVALGREIRPKFHAGILTMPAFLNQFTPAANGGPLGLRTMSDRYFARLMCGNAAIFVPTASQEAIHRPFIPHIESAAKDHLDPAKGCYQCHINMDPLASALSANFSQDVKSYAHGELRIMPGGLYYQGATYGIRGGGAPSRGALLGQPVNGLADVSRVLANSTQFNRCVIQRAMGEIYGRDPVFADLSAFNGVLNNFIKSHNYNQMIIDLISMPAFKKGD